MSKIYIAARFSRRPEANALAQQLKARGHTITSRWVLPDCDHVLPTGLSEQAADAERERFAKEDIEDLALANCLVSLQEEPRGNGRGGRHVEFGFMLGRQIEAMRVARSNPSKYVKVPEIICIGTRETVFHHLGSVHHFDTVEQYLAAVRDLTTLARPGARHGAAGGAA